jgi:hypothetical protein
LDTEVEGGYLLGEFLVVVGHLSWHPLPVDYRLKGLGRLRDSGEKATGDPLEIDVV